LIFVQIKIVCEGILNFSLYFELDIYIIFTFDPSLALI